MNSRLAPTDSYPEDLTILDDIEIQVLHSRLQRQLDHEYVHDLDADSETLFRHEEITEELDRRDLQESLWRPLLRLMTGA